MLRWLFVLASMAVIGCNVNNLRYTITRHQQLPERPGAQDVRYHEIEDRRCVVIGHFISEELETTHFNRQRDVDYDQARLDALEMAEEMGGDAVVDFGYYERGEKCGGVQIICAMYLYDLPTIPGRIRGTVIQFVE